jgi:hypothetical protein
MTKDLLLLYRDSLRQGGVAQWHQRLMHSAATSLENAGFMPGAVIDLTNEDITPKHFSAWRGVWVAEPGANPTFRVLCFAGAARRPHDRLALTMEWLAVPRTEDLLEVPRDKRILARLMQAEIVVDFSGLRPAADTADFDMHLTPALEAVIALEDEALGVRSFMQTLQQALAH